MKAIKVLVIALVAAFTINTVSAQTTTPAKTGTEKSQTKKGHKHHHHKKQTKKIAKA
ncbi:hypothetical protein G7074_05835 [Pedobacter sp. HDW13]|uniref:hypothetical protein n=1 Tax=unclassified Pedobacter TaxID=2628915 RepID=UPI00131A0605|nr:MULTISPECIES: hypothetical protein [unclassified Pedobacter]QIL38845.1 hypothetical protein G7074_05835 [Pedobacter sp. HDW13]